MHPKPFPGGKEQGREPAACGPPDQDCPFVCVRGKEGGLSVVGSGSWAAGLRAGVGEWKDV